MIASWPCRPREHTQCPATVQPPGPETDAPAQPGRAGPAKRVRLTWQFGTVQCVACICSSMNMRLQAGQRAEAQGAGQAAVLLPSKAVHPEWDGMLGHVKANASMFLKCKQKGG